jgi:HD superfamily phosphohydrolase
VRDIFPGIDQLTYWRRALRMAALCHDIGHLPFSHAAEDQLLPEGKTHEDVTVELIRSPQMREIWDSVRPPLVADDIAKLAVGPKRLKSLSFSPWERILADVIIGDSFGVDRMDYLLRDSLHAGVVYGKFDHYRLIDTLRILPENESDSAAPVLGIEHGGVESAEALLLARYFMYSQVYFHPVRRAYDIHLRDFMVAWLGERGIPQALDEFLKLTDNEVHAEISRASDEESHPSHAAARRLVTRQHFRVLYERNPDDSEKNPEAGESVFSAAVAQFGSEHLRHDRYPQKRSGTVFPVRARDQRIVSSLAASEVLMRVPLVNIDYVFISPELETDGRLWLKRELNQILSTVIEGDE